ncbi:MAG: alpha/beta hydrolase [Pseudomonadota bacterium]|nr:alpha/beta hydrolase [Pseudomonadota bacterium]
MKASHLLLAIALPWLAPPIASAADKPTVVLVHGAFAESASWSGVIERLEADGFPVRAAADPLRGVHSDADGIARLVASIAGPVVLVGHSYGGSVISDTAEGEANVKALVYVAGLAPDIGETVAGLVGRFPGSTLAGSLAAPTPLADGSSDLYIAPERFREQFAADLPAAQARLMAATQRPVSDAALNEPQTRAAWKTIPSWFVYGAADRNIPEALHVFMADRAHARQVVRIEGASHVVMTSRPARVAAVIEAAAAAVAPAEAARD